MVWDISDSYPDVNLVPREREDPGGYPGVATRSQVTTRSNTDEIQVKIQDNTYGRPFVSKLWHDIRAVFSHVYLQSFLLHDIRAFFCHVYLRSFLQTRIYMRYKQACGIWGHRKSSYKRAPNYTVSKKRVRWSWKVTSVWIKHGRNGRVNFVQGLVLIHCPHSSGGCWLPYNGFVGIRWLPLERPCTLLHKCWPKQRSIQLEIPEISVRQAKHDS